MRVGVIGAGVAGLVTTKVLQQAGHEVLVVDRTPDLGGVWSATRRYPGLCTQSPKAQYALSDFPMPKAFPQWPSGEQIQSYLADYADHYEVRPRLSTEVSSVTRREGGWQLGLTSVDGSTTETVDRLVVANGIFSEPYLPTYDGVGDFEAAGGRLIPGTELHDAEEARDKHVLVVGYGKSACDVTVPISEVAASTDVIARQLLWKVPRKLHGVVNFKMLLMTRMGEALFRYRYLRGVEKLLHGPGNGIRRTMLNSVGGVSVRQYHLKELGLVPPGAMEDIVKGAIGLATEGFYEAVRAGTINVHANTVIQRLLEKDGKPHAELSDGTVLPADLVVCSTGFVPGAAFLPDEVKAELFDEQGNFVLYRQILPPTLEGLYFNGYNSSFFSPLNAEIAALWIAADLGGLVDKPSGPEMRTAAQEQLAFMDTAVGGHHNKGGKIIPFSMHNVDEVLGDLNMNIGRMTRASHWLNPINPAAYRGLTPKLLARLDATASRPTPEGRPEAPPG